MNALSAVVILLAGYALGRLSLRGMPRAMQAWWKRVGASPDISRQSLYAITAAHALLFIVTFALIALMVSAREDAIESRLRQCEQGHQQARRDQQQASQTNPQGQRGAGGSFHSKEVAQQPGAEQRNQQAKRHSAQRALACRANGSTEDKHHDVASNRFGVHGWAPCVDGPSIPQGGAA